MEQESFKTPIAISCKRCFPWERIRSLLCFALVICLLTCMAFQFIFLVSMHRQLEQVETQLRENTKISSQWERRLTISENETKAISQTLKHRKWEIKTNRARQKRTTSPQVNLSALDKRVIAVESRYIISRCKFKRFVLAPWWALNWKRFDEWNIRDCAIME